MTTWKFDVEQRVYHTLEVEADEFGKAMMLAEEAIEAGNFGTEDSAAVDFWFTETSDGQVLYAAADGTYHLGDKGQA